MRSAKKHIKPNADIHSSLMKTTITGPGSKTTRKQWHLYNRNLTPDLDPSLPVSRSKKLGSDKMEDSTLVH